MESAVNEKGLATIRRNEGAVGVCARCRHARAAVSSRSLFVRCGLAAADPTYSRYPLLPVLQCRGFVAVDARA